MLESFYSFSLGSPVAFLSMLLAVLLLAFYFHRRAGSSYGILNRVYALLMGGGDFYNEEIGRFWKERRDIERFNALFNVGAKSIGEIVEFKSWVEKFDIDVRLVTSLRKRIDLERMQVVKVKCWQPPAFIFILLFFFVVAMFFLSIAASDSALLKFKEDGQWLWLGHENAYSTSLHKLFNDGEGWVISKSECERQEGGYEELVLISGLNIDVVSAICKSFFDGEEAGEVDEIIKEQKVFLAPAIGFFILMLIPFLEFMATSKAAVARRHILHKYISYKRR